MATPFLRVYEAFLARITADEWTLEEELAIVERDWQQLLEMAIFRFKYPRVSLNKIELFPNKVFLYMEDYTGKHMPDMIMIRNMSFPHLIFSLPGLPSVIWNTYPKKVQNGSTRNSFTRRLRM